MNGHASGTRSTHGDINLSVQASIHNHISESSMRKKQYLTHWNVSKLCVGSGRMERIEGLSFKFPLVAAVLSYQLTQKDQSQVRAFFIFPPLKRR